MKKPKICITDTAHQFSIDLTIDGETQRCSYHGTFLEHSGQKYAVLTDYHFSGLGVKLFRLEEATCDFREVTK